MPPYCCFDVDRCSKTLYALCMQIKNYKLNDIAEVILGFTFRTTLKETVDGNIAVLQAKNISDEITINSRDLATIYLDKIRTNALAKNNDVVISSRGNFKSAVIRSDKLPIIAASSTYLLRLHFKEVLPEYLSVYLNSKYGQKLIKERTTGVVISALPKKDLEDLEIITPSIKNQQKAVAVYENDLRYQKLLHQKLFLTSKINEGIINKLIIS